MPAHTLTDRQFFLIVASFIAAYLFIRLVIW